MNPSTVVFFLIGTLCIVSAIGVVASKNVIYSAILLLVSLMGIAGIYLLLLAEFLALVQILIYGGAITIVILFVIMLTRVQELREVKDNPQRPLAFLVSICLFGVLVAGILSGSSSSYDVRNSLSFSELGTSLFTKWAIPFEIASLVLLVALIGAVIIAREKGEE